MRNAIHLLALLLLAIGCNPLRGTLPLDGTVCVRPGSSDALIEATADAAQSWHERSGGRIALDVVVADGDQCDTTIAAGMLDDATGTCFYTGTPEIIVDTFRIRRDGVTPADTIAHELGHAMGADHSEKDTEVMYYQSNPYRMIRDADVRRVLGAQ